MTGAAPVHGLRTTTVSAQDAAPGTPWLFFVHGLFGQGKNFTGIAKALRGDARSVLIDLPNHGGSDWTGTVDYTQMADAVAATIGRIADDGAPVWLLGHSLGGKVAMVLAARRPELLAGLIVVDIAPMERTTDEFEHLLGSLAALDMGTISSRSDADEQLQQPIPRRSVRGFLLQNLYRADDGSWAWRANLDVLRAQLGVIGGFPDVPHDSFDGTVAWLVGSRSDYVDAAGIAAMRAIFPGVIRVTIKDAGHWVHADQPDAVVSTVREILRRNA